MDKKAKMELASLMPIALALLGGYIALTIGSDVILQVELDQCIYGDANGTCLNSSGGTGGVLGNYTTQAGNISHSGNQGLVEIGSWGGTIGTVTAAALIISLLIGSLAFGRR